MNRAIRNIVLFGTKKKKIYWTPAQMVTSAWYDASDSTKIVSSANAVSQWSDKSGNNNHMTQATGANQPLTGSSAMNGLNVLTFDGNKLLTTGLLSQALSSGRSIFVVSKQYYFDVSKFLLDSGVVSGYSSSTFFSSTTGFQYFNGSAISENTINTTNTIRELVIQNDYSATSYLYGVQSGSSSNIGNSQTVDLTIGARYGDTAHTNRYQGLIAEVLVLNVVVSTDVRQKIEGYLAHKWGLTANLPSDHPYKTNKPPV